jgi:hypothetical protein
MMALTVGVCAQNQCNFYLANQSDCGSGLVLVLQANADSSGKCALGSARGAFQHQAIHDRIAHTWVAAPEETIQLRLS